MKQDARSGMKQEGKSGESAWGGLFRVAIIGAGTLKGKEIKDVLTDRSFPATDIRLLDDEDTLGTLENVGDEPAFIQSVLPEHLERVDFTFFASEESFTAGSWHMVQNAGSEIIDLSFALEDEPGVTLRAPWIEQEFGIVPPVELKTAPVAVAHPASVAIALLAARAQRSRKIRRMMVTVMEPASERGKRGMDELHDQTVNLLSFQQMPMNVYGTQIAFNVVPGYGEEARPMLVEVEQRILRHYARIAGGQLPVPSLMLLQAPVFHGHTFSIYIEFESAVSLEELEAALGGEHVEIAHTTEDNPSNVNVAGQDQLQVLVKPDTGHENGFWLWVAADNLRIAATMAVECAEHMATTRPRGKVQ